MKYKLSVYQIEEFGQRKDAQGNPHQEDSMFPPMGDASPSDRLFIVCDGMGGHDAGEVASATVCEAMSQSILTQQPDAEGNFTVEMLQKAIDDAFDALDVRDTGAEKKMGTTMTMLKLHDHGAMIAHMGDSRVYHIRPGKDADSTKILHETWDHSLVNDLVKIGELTPEQARTSRQRNVITRAMQPHYHPRPKAEVYQTVDIKPGDIFYLCTDGMLENMEDEQIKFNFSHEAGDTERKRESLISATELNRDNHTAIIVEILDVIDPLPIPEPEVELQPDPVKPAAAPGVARKAEAAKPAMSASKQSKSFNPMVVVIIALSVALIIVLIFLVRSYTSDKTETDNDNASKPAIETSASKPSTSDISDKDASASSASDPSNVEELIENLSNTRDDAAGGETARQDDPQQTTVTPVNPDGNKPGTTTQPVLDMITESTPTGPNPIKKQSQEP